MSPDVARFRCPSCGAPVEADALQCGYCKSQISTVACPRCFAAVPASASFCGACGATLLEVHDHDTEPLPCPGCQAQMPGKVLGQTPVHACEACGGLWLDTSGLERLTASGARREAVLGSLSQADEAAPGPVVYRKCPVCQKVMNRVNYGKLSRVIVDVCRDHGTWFDRNELRRVLTFIDTGGLQKAQTRELQELQAEKARLEAKLQGSGPMPTLEDWQDRNGSGLLFRSIFKLLS